MLEFVGFISFQIDLLKFMWESQNWQRSRHETKVILMTHPSNALQILDTTLKARSSGSIIYVSVLSILFWMMMFKTHSDAKNSSFSEDSSRCTFFFFFFWESVIILMYPILMMDGWIDLDR